MGHDEQLLDPLEGGVQTGEVAGEYVMPVLEEISIVQRRSVLRHDQGRFFIVSIQGQGNTKPVN